VTLLFGGASRSNRADSDVETAQSRNFYGATEGLQPIAKRVALEVGFRSSLENLAEKMKRTF
jgi:hypothetical protein